MGQRNRASTGLRGSVIAMTVMAMAALCLAPGAAAGADVDDRPAAGSPTIGDPYFPGLGNGGYDVAHYDVAERVSHRPLGAYFHAWLDERPLPPFPATPAMG